MRNNNNPTYKDSPLGKIPSDWVVTELCEIAFINMGQSPDSLNYNEHANGLPLIQGNADMKERKSIQRIYTTQITKICDKGDYIMSVRAPVGSIGIASQKSCIGRGVCSIKPRDINNDFLFQLLLYSEVKWSRIEQGSTFTAVSSADVRNFKVLLPTNKFEQKAISYILNLMDSAINTNNQLIAKKELQKKWLMQNLLTGRKRLKSFGLEWKNYKLEYFIEDYNEKPKDEIKYEVLTSAKAGLMKQTDYYGDNRITNREDADYNVIPPNYLTYRSRSDDGLFTFNKNTLGFVGLISGYYPVFTIKNGNLDFILMYCNFYRYKFRKYCIGTSQLVLSINALKSANFTLPQKEEQTAIAEVLQTADKEIKLLKTKAEKLREQKKGLMQVLLTGKKRLLNT